MTVISHAQWERLQVRLRALDLPPSTGSVVVHFGHADRATRETWVGKMLALVEPGVHCWRPSGSVRKW